MQPDTARLRTLATEILPAVPPEDFYLGFWRCGTVGCAIGHAGSYPPFNQEGFSLTKMKGKPNSLCPQYVNAAGETLYFWKAVCEFFKLTQEQAIYLFSANCYPLRTATSITVVIDRLTQFINEVEQQ